MLSAPRPATASTPWWTPPCPRRSASAAPLRLPEPRGEHELIDDLREIAVAQRGLPLVHRHGLPRLHHAARHPAQRAGEPGLVHAVHALPGGDRPGPAGGAAQLPDHGGGPHRPAAGQRLAARRGHRGRGGDGDVRRARARHQRTAFFVAAADCHPQTIAVVRTRARSLGIEVVVADPARDGDRARTLFGVLVQYPTTDGRIVDYAPLAERAHAAGALVVVAADLLALTLLRPPGRVRGRHRRRLDASASACRWASAGRTPRSCPPATSTSGRSRAGSSASRKDRDGRPAFRLALQTREQHIRRDKATSNICTAQVLLAIMASMYARLPRARRAARDRARAIHAPDRAPGRGPDAASASIVGRRARSSTPCASRCRRARRRGSCERAAQRRINLRDYGDGSLGVSLDETTLAVRRGALCWTCSRARRAPASRSRTLDGGGRDFAGAVRAHQRRTSPTRSSTATTPSTRCCATSTACRRATSR